ncbi:MAG TPA: AtpZ/AtpI family protein [Flavobacterium sp.]|nr:AtpZ/AtpI family protein [Flavobacterium sp.]
MGIVIFVFTYFGAWLDEKYSAGSSTLYTIVFSLLSVFISLYNVFGKLKILIKITNDQNCIFPKIFNTIHLTLICCATLWYGGIKCKS